jgi:hypothetical protein
MWKGTASVKKIIDGVTYNTDTSTAVARWEGENPDGHQTVDTLYQTHGGAFFIHSHETWAVKGEQGGWEERQRDLFDPYTRDAAEKWFLEGDVTVLSDDVFPEPPETEGGFTASTTIYLRIPTTLMQQIEARAKEQSQSVNVWAMRCLEKCAQ